jgi:bifunctional non-homologous end joining protein LigD
MPARPAGGAKTVETITVDGHRLQLTNLDKVLYPKTGFTKGQVVDYYGRVAHALLPHVRGRAVSMKRYPDGVEVEPFYQKEAPPNRPAWMPTIDVPSESRAGGILHYMSCNDAASLLWLANAANLELHTFLHKGQEVDHPTSIVFDLDPGPGKTVLDCARLGLDLRASLQAIGLESVPKVSGSKGVHVHVPLNTPARYEQSTAVAKTVAVAFERSHGEVVSNMKKELRQGKILMDWSQNNTHKTTVCAYSLRGRPEPTVAAPVAWRELEAAVDRDDAGRLTFLAADVLKRVEAKGDLFEPMDTLEQDLPRLG